MEQGLALADVNRRYRKTLVASALVGGAGLLVASFLGHPVAGGLFCAGLVLGLVNSRLVIGATARFASDADASKRRFAFGALQRLAVITLVALLLAYAFRPEGLAVFAGLVAFQMILIAGATGPMLREVRKG